MCAYFFTDVIKRTNIKKKPSQQSQCEKQVSIGENKIPICNRIPFQRKVPIFYRNVLTPKVTIYLRQLSLFFDSKLLFLSIVTVIVAVKLRK